MELLIVFLAVALLVLVDGASARWGVDSRPDSTDPRSNARGLFVQ